MKRIGMAVLVAFTMAMGLSAQAQEKSSGVMVTADELQKMVEPSLLIAGTHVLKVQNFFADLYVRGGVVYAVYTQATGAGGPTKAKWRLDGDKFCRIHALEGERCAHFYRLADGSFEARAVPGDELVATFRIINNR